MITATIFLLVIIAMVTKMIIDVQKSKKRKLQYGEDDFQQQ